jgi:Viral BACON domain
MRYFGLWLSRGCLAALLLAGNAHASSPFFDNFQQFPNGTVLSPTNYVPFVGTSVAITNLNTAANPTTVVATNFPGTTQALFEQGTLPYSEDYLGFPAIAQTNAVVTLSFTLLIPALQTAGHFGGFDVSLPMTGGGDNPLLLFNDDGGVLVFTNQASTTPLVLPFVQIGSWSALQNTVMTNVLVLDYSAGTYSFSLNGAVLTNDMPIPGYFTNLFDAVRMQAFESVTNAGVDSLGNSFALGNVQLSVPASSTNQDLSQYTPAAKGQLFDQFTSGAPTLSVTGFMFQTSVTGTGSNTILGATVQAPSGSNIVLSLSESENSKFKFQALFTSLSDMDAIFTNGNYLMAIGTADDGTLTPALTVTGDAYPNAPQVLNFDAAQVIDVSTNFVFTWGPFTNGTTDDVISFEIDDGSGNTITNTPDLGEPGQLDGTITNFTVTAGILTAGTTNTGHLEFIKVTARDTNSVSGALGVTGYFAETQFSIVVGTTVCVFAISPTNATFDATGGSGGINITAPNGCAWSATNNDSFITINSGSTGSGNGTVGYTIAANLSSDVLTGTITAAGQTFTVVQTGVACTFSLDSTNADFGAAGGSSNIVVTANGTNCAWTAVSSSDFITINSGSSGSGNGLVSYTVATNANAIDQTGSMTIAGQTYIVTQAAAACAFSLDFTNASVSAAGASGDITVTANGTNCDWTAVSNDSFITITNGTSGTSGTGNGTVTVTVATNTDTVARTGTLTIAGQTFTVTEDAAACIVSIDSTAANFPATGGSSNVMVTANGTNCDWTAISNSSSITITSGTNGIGSDTVSYTVTANTGTARTVTMTIADQTFTVHQAGATLGFAFTNVVQTCKTRIVKRTSTTNTTCTVNFDLVVSNTGVANTPKFYVLIWLKQGSVFSPNVGVVFLAKRVNALKEGKLATFKIRKPSLNGDQAGTFLFVTDTDNNVLASVEIPSPQ